MSSKYLQEVQLKVPVTWIDGSTDYHIMVHHTCGLVCGFRSCFWKNVEGKGASNEKNHGPSSGLLLICDDKYTVCLYDTCIPIKQDTYIWILNHQCTTHQSWAYSRAKTAQDEITFWLMLLGCIVCCSSLKLDVHYCSLVVCFSSSSSGWSTI